MSTPAGWYDDGSGRQRWWDGAQWTENYAPVQGGEEGASAVAAAPAAPLAPESPNLRPAPTLGFIGLGLAVIGTILACIPVVVVFIIGLVVLLAALVVSVIAVFKKNTRKWPAIVGIVLSVVGGIIGSIVFSVVLFVSLVNTANGQFPTDSPTSITSEQPSDAPGDDASDGRPAPDAIGEGLRDILQAGGVTEYDDMPDFYPCMGQSLYDSELSDEALQSMASGVPMEQSDPEAGVYEEAISTGVLTCDPQ